MLGVTQTTEISLSRWVSAPNDSNKKTPARLCWIGCKLSMKIWKRLWRVKSLQHKRKWWTVYISMKRLIPVRSLEGKQGHQAGHQKKLLSWIGHCRRIWADVVWVTKMRRCQTAEILQQKCWRKLENWKLNTEVWPCVVQSKANALKRHRCWQKTHHTCGCCSCDLWIWEMYFIFRTLEYLMEIRWWFWTGCQWQSWEAVGNQVDNSFPQPTPAPSFWLLMLPFQAGEHSSPAAFCSCCPACKPLTNSTL